MSTRPLILAVSTALVAATGLAWLTSAVAFDGGSNNALDLAQAAPPAATPPAAGGGPDRRMQRGEQAFSPRAACQEVVARRAGNRAYIKVRLELKPEQMPAWSAFEKAADEVTAKANAKCATLPTDAKTRPNFTDRLTMREDMMKTRLEGIQAVKPSMLALYAALTPEQQAILDRPMAGFGRRGHGGPGMGPR
ncbi:MAG: Spy/CpxP family protein refolding chaperone [Reyranellales bacterium]